MANLTRRIQVQVPTLVSRFGARLCLGVKETSTTAQSLLGGGRRNMASLSKATLPARAELYALLDDTALFRGLGSSH